MKFRIQVSNQDPNTLKGCWMVSRHWDIDVGPCSTKTIGGRDIVHPVDYCPRGATVYDNLREAIAAASREPLVCNTLEGYFAVANGTYEESFA